MGIFNRIHRDAIVLVDLPGPDLARGQDRCRVGQPLLGAANVDIGLHIGEDSRDQPVGRRRAEHLHPPAAPGIGEGGERGQAGRMVVVQMGQEYRRHRPLGHARTNQLAADPFARIDDIGLAVDGDQAGDACPVDQTARPAAGAEQRQRRAARRDGRGRPRLCGDGGAQHRQGGKRQCPAEQDGFVHGFYPLLQNLVLSRRP